ncbi:MAG: hypothetical protein WDZ49_16680 [Litorilinea sp.]
MGYRHSLYRHSLRWVLIDAAARFLDLNPQWAEYFFNLDFLLNRGLPIVERHIAGIASNSAIDLALAWAEEWPAMNASQRKVCLQAQTVIAAELLTLVAEEMLRLHPSLQNLTQARDERLRGMGIPLAYVKSHNPPGHSDTDLQQLWETVAQHQGDLLQENEDCVAQSSTV